MFNLLPQPEQQELAREYRLRLASTALLFLAALGALSLVALAPSLFLSHQKEAVVVRSDEALKKESVLHGKDDPSSILQSTNEKLSALQSATSTLYAYEIIDNITEVKPASVKIRGISVRDSGTGGHSVAITGQARDRDALLAFVRVLESQTAFPTVTVPVSNFAAASDIDFSLLIKAK